MIRGWLLLVGLGLAETGCNPPMQQRLELGPGVAGGPAYQCVGNSRTTMTCTPLPAQAGAVPQISVTSTPKPIFKMEVGE